MSTRTYGLYFDPESEDHYVSVLGGVMLLAEFLTDGGQVESMEGMVFNGRHTIPQLRRIMWPGSGRPNVGDMADHKSGELDPRPVAWVAPDGRTIKLDIFGKVTPEVPTSNYTFTTRVPA
jgi:hypothetical protein